MGEEWKEQRKFSLRIMRDLGMGKPEFEQAILQEIQDLMQRIHDQGQRSIDVHHPLGSSVTNVVHYFLMGKHLHADDPIRKMIDDNFLPRYNPSMYSIAFYLPIFSIIPRIPFTPGHIFLKRSERVIAYMRRQFDLLTRQSEEAITHSFGANVGQGAANIAAAEEHEAGECFMQVYHRDEEQEGKVLR